VDTLAVLDISALQHSARCNKYRLTYAMAEPRQNQPVLQLIISAGRSMLGLGSFCLWRLMHDAASRAAAALAACPRSSRACACAAASIQVLQKLWVTFVAAQSDGIKWLLLLPDKSLKRTAVGPKQAAAVHTDMPGPQEQCCRD
jgi:hypothetical protein